jgi:tetratricopeptide (TPR) repeat protein
MLCLGIALARRWQLKREESLRTPEGGRVFNWVVNQRTFMFVAVLTIVLLGAYGYQQYLWRVALPIPDDAIGFAITREASAASFQDQLADSLYTQGQASEIVIRELPVAFDASDTERARELGTRINAEAVIIYREDEAPRHESERYVAYVVFTDPTISLILGAPAGEDTAALEVGLPAVQIKEGVPVPVLKTATLEELVNAAAGIIDYNNYRLRDSIEHLEQAIPKDPGAANTGIVNFYLGNAYQLDGNTGAARLAFEAAATFYQGPNEDGSTIGAQDRLLLLKTYLELGEIAGLQGDAQTALSWYDKGLSLREDLVSRADGLERPSDVPATYARLYTLMADAYRALDQAEDEAFWQQRAMDELTVLAGSESTTDPYPIIQQASAHFFLGQCVEASDAFKRALVVDPANLDAQTGLGIVALLQGKPDLALAAWQEIVAWQPEDVNARMLIGNLYVLRAMGDTHFDLDDMLEAERYYLEVVALDPTNVGAHDELAELAQLRAQAAMLDSTALATGDNLTVEKSQILWVDDPARQREALDAYGIMIQHRRIESSELRPGDPAAQAAVATAYAERESFLFTLLLNAAINAAPEPAATAAISATPQVVATPPVFPEAMEQQFLDDGEQVLEWASRVLDNPDASHASLLEAHAARVGALQRIWFFHTYLIPDEERAAAAEGPYRQAVEESIAFGEAQPPTLNEIASLRLIYFSAESYYLFVEDDDAAAAAIEVKITDITARESRERTAGTTHIMTLCDEVREAVAGDEAAARGDSEAALEHYDASLAANPAHLPALLGAGRIYLAQGDLAAAIGSAEQATEVAPADAQAWADLALYRLSYGDTAGAGKAYDQFLVLLNDAGTQRGMVWLAAVFDDLQGLLDDGHAKPALVAGLLSRFAGALETMQEDAGRNYQYAALYTDLGHLALWAEAPDDAAAWFRRGLELDPHQPNAYPGLVVAVALQGEDPLPVIEWAIQESRDPLWTRTTETTQEQVLTIMERSANNLQDDFPDGNGALDALLRAIQIEREATTP